MITPSFSLTATERVLPKLALDFTTASLDPRVTFIRTTDATHPATYVNSSGIVTAATNNQPRFDYDPVTLACKGLLIEESRTNVLTYSQDLSNVAWVAGNANVTTDAATAPDGTSTADKLYENLATSTHLIYQQYTTTAQAYTFSGFVKPAGNNYVILYNDGLGGGYSFNLSNGTVGGSIGTAPTSASITNYGNGWYRCSITWTATASTNTSRFYLTYNGTSTNYAGSGVNGVYIWGAQQEAGSFATSYIPTTTTALTRNADVATMTGNNFSYWYNQSQGALYAEISGFPTVSTGRAGVVTMKAANTQSSIAMGRSYAGGTTNILYGGCFDTNVTQAYIAGATVVANTPYKMCMAYKANSFAISVNGAAVVQDTSGTVPSLTNMEIGCYDATYFVNSCVKKVMFYIQRLTNAEVQAFTK